MSLADFTRPGVWTELFPHALKLIAHIETVSENSTWTFVGGTVLMLRINHRLSKDIDLFVSDPQYLPYVNQGDRIREYAARRGLEIVATYADEGKSGLRREAKWLSPLLEKWPHERSSTQLSCNGLDLIEPPS